MPGCCRCDTPHQKQKGNLPPGTISDNRICWVLGLRHAQNFLHICAASAVSLHLTFNYQQRDCTSTSPLRSQKQSSDELSQNGAICPSRNLAKFSKSELSELYPDLESPHKRERAIDLQFFISQTMLSDSCVGCGFKRCWRVCRTSLRPTMWHPTGPNLRPT